MEENKSIEDWRSDISDSDTAVLKIQDGEEVTISFLDEGKKFTHPDYGESIVFLVKKGEEDMRWFVNPNNFALLKQIKELGKLTGQSVKVKRTGSKKSDTRYTLEKI